LAASFLLFQRSKPEKRRLYDIGEPLEDPCFPHVAFEEWGARILAAWAWILGEEELIIAWNQIGFFFWTRVQSALGGTGVVAAGVENDGCVAHGEW
jgi:hypothetical protein